MSTDGSASAMSTPAQRQRLENLVCFVIANRTFALDVGLVREVVSIGQLFPVPRAPAAIAGVFSLRGATVALVNTPRLLDIAETTPLTSALVIVRGHQVLCALTIDRVIGVTRFIERHFIAADPEREPAQVSGFMPDERGGLLTILDSSVIVSSLERLRFH